MTDPLLDLADVLDGWRSHTAEVYIAAGLDPRAAHALARAGLDPMSCSDEEALAAPNFGVTCLARRAAWQDSILDTPETGDET